MLMTVLTSASALLAYCAPTQAQDQDPALCEEKLISYLHWKETPTTAWSLHITAKSGGNLQYIGVTHSDDATDCQFQHIKQAWETQKPTIAFFEGPDRGIAASETETIEKFGESGFVRYLAKASGIKTRTLEPGPQEEAEYLLSLGKFTLEQIKLFYILREASRLRDRKGMDKEQIKEAVSQLLPKVNQLIPALAGVLPDTAFLQPAFKKYWAAPSEWWQAPAAWFDPLKNSAETGGKFTNEINSRSSEFRNLHMYRLLTNAVLRGEKVLAVVGRNHVPMQAQAIRCALQ
ncbi:hypothetical protein [Pontibacter liquoris]|uniref:hypothetical protein n=1 Tax=Pontibacter liquoris TaxID=2905677 RepID=UPI001FA7A647|nr:hypothetical protein [Pontibacter liquoris]